MLFNSIEFLLFLPLVFVLYWFVFNRNLNLQNLFIVIASYVFYGWWSPSFLILIFITTLCSYLSGLLIVKLRRRSAQKLVTTLNVLLNLGILGVYKYYDFFVENLVSAFAAFDVTLHTSSLNLILPVGISFYTFQALSYTIDVYRKDIEATSDLISFFAYISFFPQLVAGPIERASNIIPQFQKKRCFNYSEAVEGVRQMLWGFFKKVVIADNCAPLVNQIFDNYQEQSSGVLVLGGFYFTMQIYGDFSGYSDIALGTAKLFGIRLMDNFDRPYFARNIAEFWRKWHISLMTWFRDYIYFPLGGSRVSKMKTIRNTFIVFGISGLWHGANWTFIVWGFYHACLFLPKLLGLSDHKIARATRWSSMRAYLSVLFTFCSVLIGWIIFRADNLYHAVDYITRMFSLVDIDSTYIFSRLDRKVLIFILLMLLFDWVFKRHKFTLSTLHADSATVCANSKLIKYYLRYRWFIYYGIALLLFLCAGSQSQFIYFQF